MTATPRAVYEAMAFVSWHFDEIYLPQRDAFYRAIVARHIGARFESDPQPDDPHALKLVTRLHRLSERNQIYARTACAEAARLMARRIAFIRSARRHQGGVIFMYDAGSNQPLESIPATSDAARLFSPQMIAKLKATM